MVAEEQSWSVARLIPTSGINGADEQERRATSALLAVLSSVKEFARSVTMPLGAPAGAIETYIEVPFDVDGKRVFPDGLIRVKRGSKTWTALVEVKTGVNELKTEQLENYLDVARAHGFQALLTISNEIPPAIGSHPTAIDKRKLRKVDLFHLSWSEVLTQAVMQKEFRGVADPDQAWILGELIRYLEHPKSGALAFEDMGSGWVPVREAVSAGTLRTTDKNAMDVAGRFDALIRFACLQLGRKLGTEVTPNLNRQFTSEPSTRITHLVGSMVSGGALSGSIRIPNAIAPLEVVVDLRANRVTCYFDVSAPAEGKATTRVNWLLRQLKDAPDSLRIEAFSLRSRAGTAELLRDVRTNGVKLVQDPTKEIRSFRVALSAPLGAKRGRGRGSFIDSVLDAIDDTYREVGQRVKAWSAAPPRLRSEAEVEVEEGIDSSLPSNAISSQDESSAAPSYPF
jgi:hypothetical protein